VSSVSIACGSTIASVIVLDPYSELSETVIRAQLNNLNPSPAIGAISDLAVSVYSQTAAPTAAPTADSGFFPGLSMTNSIIAAAVPGGFLVCLAFWLIVCCCCCKKGKKMERRESLPASQPAMTTSFEDTQKDFGPLPPGWKAFVVGPDDGQPDQIGKTYYFNEYKGWAEWDIAAVFAHPRLEIVAPSETDKNDAPVFSEISDDVLPAPAMDTAATSSNYQFQPEMSFSPNNICMRQGCNNPFQLRCPTCLEQGLPDFSVCSQECLVEAWPDHSTERGH